MNLQTKTDHPSEILIIEDEKNDIRLIKRGFEKAKRTNHLHVVMDGEEAINFLRKEGSHANAVRPDLILLDLKLPKKDGHEVLMEIKMDEDLKRIPVVMLSSSEAEMDIIKSYNLGANCYIRKPIGLDEINEVTKLIIDFWFCVARLSPN